ncbi:MAG: hypothetical protein AAB403_16730 [Planctomycetota bacterium]
MAAVLAANTYTTHPELTILVSTLYVVVLILIFVATFRSRRARDQIQGEVVWGQFALINKEIFKGDYRTRFTLFKEDSFHRGQISPWYRYFKGGRGPIKEAEESRARYSRTKADGLTGQAWQEAGRCMLWRLFPKFNNRQEFEDYYINKLGMSEKTVKHLSDYMIGVQSMFCFGFVCRREKTLGVLSIDFKAPLTVDAQGEPSFPSPENDAQIPLDRERLNILLSSMQAVLESFEESDRRER